MRDGKLKDTDRRKGKIWKKLIGKEVRPMI